MQRRILWTIAVLAAVALVAAMMVGRSTGTKNAADPGFLSVEQECQQALGYPARTKADVNWLKTCVHALTPPTVSPSPTATSPSPSPTTPSPTPTTPSPSPTTPSPTATTPSPTPTTPSPTTTTPSSGCPVAGKDVPGAADPWGGCWPGPGNTGVPAGTVLTDYTGPCDITVANTVIDSKTVTCSSLLIHATGVLIKNSLLQDVDLDNGSIPTNSSFVIVDSTVVNGAREQCGCVAGHDFTALRLEIRGGNRSSYCIDTCTIQDSWLHGQQLQDAQHGSGLREEQDTTAVHDVLVCDYPITNDVTSLGCSAGLTGYPDFTPIKNNLIQRNLFLPSLTVSFCAYGGATGGKPYSSDPTNATNQRFLENVFVRGSNGKCGFYGPITDFDTTRPGNLWQGNVWDDGTAVQPG